ncbi:LysR family transcriptional regulator [Yersinia aldovae]|uniref:LysR substrate-binding domain-containing protein n=1 Tax=Yersinia aldovae TaxID=29483 RepID=UPI0021BD875D|nr:LysR family transcriptional regulator [Yersinia aldovae]
MGDYHITRCKILPTFNQLVHFCTLAEVGHVGRAAEKLNMSQPPLSRQIALLESTVSVMLFERGAKGVSLTLAGEQFLQDAREIINLMHQANKNAQAIAAGQSGILTLGSTMYASYSVVPHIARQHKITQPEIELRLQEMIPSDLKKALLDGTIDAAISFANTTTPTLNSMTLLQELLLAALPKHHPCAGVERLSLDQLAHDDFIMVPREIAPTLHDSIVTKCRQAGFSPKIGLEVFTQQSAVNFVAHDFGVALIPASMQYAPVNGVIYKQLEDAPYIQNVLMWSTKNKNTCLKSFLALCRDFSHGQGSKE